MRNLSNSAFSILTDRATMLAHRNDKDKKLNSLDAIKLRNNYPSFVISVDNVACMPSTNSNPPSIAFGLKL